MVSPSTSKHILNPTHISKKLRLDLFDPHDLCRKIWYVDAVGNILGQGSVLWVRKHLLQLINVQLHSSNQCCLIFAYCWLNMYSNKQGIIARKDWKHLIGILCSSKLIPKSRRQLRFDVADLLIIVLPCTVPLLLAFFCDVQIIDLL